MCSWQEGRFLTNIPAPREGTEAVWSWQPCLDSNQWMKRDPRLSPMCVVIQPVSSPVGFSPGSSIPGRFMNFSWRELSTPWSPSLLPQGRVSLVPHGWTNTAGPSGERRYPPPSRNLPCNLHSPCTVCVGPLLLRPMFTQRHSGCP